MIPLAPVPFCVLGLLLILAGISGVFFRKYTQQQGNRLGLKGWCRNTVRGTVEGILEGNSNDVHQM